MMPVVRPHVDEVGSWIDVMTALPNGRNPESEHPMPVERLLTRTMALPHLLEGRRSNDEPRATGQVWGSLQNIKLG